MNVDRVDALVALLNGAENAHATYEATELGGVYDAEWPTWYAGYALEHGIDSILGRDVSQGELAAGLAAGYAEFQAEPDAAEPWAAYIARRLLDAP
jgi:hypothetical protein